MKYLVHAGTGTVIALDECVVVDDNDITDDYTLDDLFDSADTVAEQYGKPVGPALRETIPCSNCGQEVWDDDDNAHVNTGSYNCEETH